MYYNSYRDGKYLNSNLIINLYKFQLIEIEFTLDYKPRFGMLPMPRWGSLDE